MCIGNGIYDPWYKLYVLSLNVSPTFTLMESACLRPQKSKDEQDRASLSLSNQHCSQRQNKISENLYACTAAVTQCAGRSVRQSVGRETVTRGHEQPMF